MESHELVNHINRRLGPRVQFTDIMSSGGTGSQVHFIYASREYSAVSNPGSDSVKLLEVANGEEYEFSLFAKYYEGLINGGKRDDSGKLIAKGTSDGSDESN